MRAEGAVGRVWWYLDGTYIGSALPNETFFHRVPDGRHVVGAVDEEGRSAYTNVSVVTPGKKRKAEYVIGSVTGNDIILTYLDNEIRA